MGVYGSYEGKIEIPETKSDEFIKAIMRLLQEGGMMQFETISLYNKKISLISPVELDESGNADFHYNYMADEAWEDASFSADNLSLYSGKIGSYEFRWVMTACYLLYEFYSTSYGYACVDGSIVNLRCYIQWINFVLDKDYSFKRRFELWKYYESYYIRERKYGYSVKSKLDTAMKFLPDKLRLYMGGTDLADIVYLAEGTSSLEHEEIPKGSYAEEILNVRYALKELYDTYGENQKDVLWNLLTLPMQERRQVKDKKYEWLAEATLRLPARVFVYISAELLGFDFWSEWSEMYNNVYADENCCEYADEEIIKQREKNRLEPETKMKTAEFLYNDGPFTFYRTPEELKNKPNYYISDDDLMFWWDESDKVELSEKMVEQLEEWAEQLDRIEQEIGEDIEQYDMLKMLINDLHKANQDYVRIYAFKSMFYDFFENSMNKRYIAAVRLLEKVLADNWKDGKIIHKCTSSWDMCSRNVTFNQGRVNVKRYLSVMANRKLRMKYFGF